MTWMFDIELRTEMTKRYELDAYRGNLLSCIFRGVF